MLRQLRSSKQISISRTPFDSPSGRGEKAGKSKQKLRLERKKRKLLALSAVMVLNQQEGVGKQNKNKRQPSADSNQAQEAEAGARHTKDSTTTSEATLRKILVSNHTAFDISEQEDGVDNSELSPSMAKRRKQTKLSNAQITSKVECLDNGSNNVHSLNSEEEYRALKAFVNQKKNMRYSPRIVLKPVGEDALLDRPPSSDRIPLLLDDIQALLMYALLGTESPSAPRWATIQRSTKLTHTMVLVVEGFSCEDYVNLREHMPFSSNPSGVFGADHTLQVVCPTTKLVEEMACVPLSDTHKDILVAEYGSLEAAMKICKDQMLQRRSIFRNILPEACEADVDYSHLDLPPTDKFPRTLLLLSPIQMINEGFPLPLSGTLRRRYNDYVTTSEFYQPVSPRSPMFGLDCEMCGAAGNKSVLTRVSVVNEAGQIMYDELVKPREPIFDYRTKYSGITKSMLRDVTKRLEDVQKELRQLLPRDAILVGQSLNCDMDALRMMHPYVIDTSIVFNLTGDANQKQKLSVLSSKFLQKEIQCGNEGHNPIEDCSASLDLVKMKLSKSIYYGDQWLLDRQNYHRFTRAGGKVGIANINSIDPGPSEQLNGTASVQEQITTSLFAHAKKRNKRSAIMTNGKNLNNFEAYFANTIKQHEQAEASRQYLSFSRLPSAQETVQQAAAHSLLYDFNLVHVKLPQADKDPENAHDSEGSKVAVARQIDRWIKQLHCSLSLNGLFVVLLAGQEEKTGKANRMAVAMVQTRK